VEDHSRAVLPLPSRNEEATSPVAPSLSGPAIVYQHRSEHFIVTGASRKHIESVSACAQRCCTASRASQNSCGARDTRVARNPLLASLSSRWGCDSGSYRSTYVDDPPDSQRSKHSRIVACYFEACSFAVCPRHQCMAGANPLATREPKQGGTRTASGTRAGMPCIGRSWGCRGGSRNAHQLTPECSVVSSTGPSARRSLTQYNITSSHATSRSLCLHTTDHPRSHPSQNLLQHPSEPVTLPALRLWCMTGLIH
jgi:hypothetical protein